MKLNNIWDKRKVSKFVTGIIIVLIISCAKILAESETLEKPETIAKTFEYKLSFKGPYMVMKNGTVPFWEHQGSAIASDESVRITPSLRSKKGSIWSRELCQHKNWEIDVTFRVSGRGKIGADGLAVWYTTDRSVEGPVFGSKDQWNGLGVFLDSFDNDNKHNNPYIMAMVNDGTKEFDHEVDGSNQQLGGCLRDFRNRPYPNKIKIQYYKNNLSILFNNGLTEDPENYEVCLKVLDVVLPPTGYFGVSAATGGLADDHDVLSFITTSLHPQSLSEADNQAMEDEKKKIAKEYQDFQEKMQKAREEYKKENPKAEKELEMDENSIYEAQEARELRQIFEGQHQIAMMVRSMMDKLSDLEGKQERHVASLAEISQKLNQQAAADSAGGSDQQDIVQVMRAQTIFSGDIKELKSHVEVLGNKLSTFTSQDSAKNERLAHLLEARTQEETMNMHRQFKLLQAQLTSSQSTSSGVSLTHLIILLSLQLLAIFAALYYKARKEAAAKKLF